MNLEPEVSSTSQADPVPAVVIQSDDVVERTRRVMEQHWSCNIDDNGKGGSDEDEGEEDIDKDEEVEDEDDIDEDEEDIDENDKDTNKDDEDTNEDEDNEDENTIPGLSAWDLLGESFERDAAALGLFQASE